MKATWQDTVLASGDDTVVVEGNHYFAPETLDMQYFRPSATQTVCGWKGTASYYDVVAGGETNKDAAWFYPSPKTEAKEIENHVAFWKGVEVVA